MRLSAHERALLRHAEALAQTPTPAQGIPDEAEQIVRWCLSQARAAYYMGLYKAHALRTPRWRTEAAATLDWRDEMGPQISLVLDLIDPPRILGYYEAEFMQRLVEPQDPLTVHLWFHEALQLVEAAEAFVEHSGSQRLAEETLTQVQAVLDARPDLRRKVAYIARGRRLTRNSGWVLELLDIVGDA